MPVDLICLTPQERTIYQALVDAAENSLVCPNYLDLNELVGYESSSSSPAVVGRLEDKGLIVRTIDNNRFRRIKIVATGKWTKPSPDMRTSSPFVVKGTHDPNPLTKAMIDMVKLLFSTEDEAEAEKLAREVLDYSIFGFPSLLKLEKRIDRVKELVVRRKGHFLTNPDKGRL